MEKEEIFLPLGIERRVNLEDFRGFFSTSTPLCEVSTRICQLKFSRSLFGESSKTAPGQCSAAWNANFWYDSGWLLIFSCIKLGANRVLFIEGRNFSAEPYAASFLWSLMSTDLCNNWKVHTHLNRHECRHYARMIRETSLK